MEKKTTEEMRVAVLAYCETVCPHESNKATLEVGMLKRQSMGRVFYWLHVDGLSTIAIEENATDDHIFAAYRLLGLETRDAIADYKASLQSDINSMTAIVSSVKQGTAPDYVHVSKLKELEAKNAALVEVLGEVKRYCESGNRGGATRLPASDKFRAEGMYQEVIEALAANKKGGANG